MLRKVHRSAGWPRVESDRAKTYMWKSHPQMLAYPANLSFIQKKISWDEKNPARNERQTSCQVREGEQHKLQTNLEEAKSVEHRSCWIKQKFGMYECIFFGRGDWCKAKYSEHPNQHDCENRKKIRPKIGTQRCSEDIMVLVNAVCLGSSSPTSVAYKFQQFFNVAGYGCLFQ